jgi:hypothetical protein
MDVAKNTTETSSCCGEFDLAVETKTVFRNFRHQLHAGPALEMREMRHRPDAAMQPSKNRTSNLQDRLLGPKRLCFANGLGPERQPQVQALEVDEWQSQHPEAGFPSFLFVSYTSHHFPTQSEMTLCGDFGSNTTQAEKDYRLYASLENRRALAELAARVVLGNFLDAFWIDFESGVDHSVGSDDDDPGAYAICDILRASKSMIIVVGPPYQPADTRRQNLLEGRPRPELRNQWLASWGERLWTLPELLFCPNRDVIPIYTLNDQPPEILSKYSITRTFTDGKSVRELIDHYSGTVQLSPLELTVTATQCLFTRPHNRFSPGDASYALMGLMRRRPKVNKNDSAFRAFTRLSFLNDNDRLLERLICLQPDLTRRRPWSSMYDAYQASLWDIEPCTQVGGHCQCTARQRSESEDSKLQRGRRL